MELLWEIAGWSGAVLILSAYLSVSMGWLKAGKRFQVANLIGACAFIVNGAVHEAWPSVVTNVAWCLISAIAILRMRATQESPVPQPRHRRCNFPASLTPPARSLLSRQLRLPFTATSPDGRLSARPACVRRGRQCRRRGRPELGAVRSPARTFRFPTTPGRRGLRPRSPVARCSLRTSAGWDR